MVKRSGSQRIPHLMPSAPQQSRVIIVTSADPGSSTVLAFEKANQITQTTDLDADRDHR